MFDFSVVVRFDKEVVVGRFEDDESHHFVLEIIDGNQSDAQSLSASDGTGRLDREVERRRSIKLLAKNELGSFSVCRNLFLNLNYHDDFVEHTETEFRVITESVDEPTFIGGGDTPVVEFDAVVCRRDVVPGPISVQPIVKVLEIF